jgi:hypothetical protein
VTNQLEAVRQPLPAVDQTLPPLLTPVAPDTPVELPHATWNENWRPILARFGAAASTMKPAKRISYEPIPPRLRARSAWTRLRTGHGLPGIYTNTWDLPVNAIRDTGLRREMMSLADAFRHYELPEQEAVILTDMLGPLDEAALQLFGWLRAALVELAGDRSAAIAAPTGFTGSLESDKPSAFEPHSDMWIPALLFNIFNDAVPGQGATTLLPIEQMWDVIAEAGMPEESIVQLQQAQVDAGECDYYEQFNGLLYKDHPWSDAVKEALVETSVEVHMAKGQGYFVNDRVWLHGRTALMPGALAPDRRDHRLYRLAYNNARLEAAAGERRIDWARVGRTAAGCKV